MSDIPPISSLFYLRNPDLWPRSRAGTFFIEAMREAGRRRFADPTWRGPASTYHFTTALPSAASEIPDIQAEVVRILEWHDPDIHIERYALHDKDEDTPTGAIINHWTSYDLTSAHWQRAREIAAFVQEQPDANLKRVDELLGDFADRAYRGALKTFTLREADRTPIPISAKFWDVGLAEMRARHALGRYDPGFAGSRAPRGDAAIFVDTDDLATWLAEITPILSDTPPNAEAARAFLTDLEAQLRVAAIKRHVAQGDKKSEMGIPGGIETLFLLLRKPPCNLDRRGFDALIRERSEDVFLKKGKPADQKLTTEIIRTLALNHLGVVWTRE